MLRHPVTVLVLELRGLVIVPEAIKVVSQGLVHSLLEHVLAYDVPDGVEDLLHLLIGDCYCVGYTANMFFGDQGPSFRPSGLEFST